jgi:hypothetical protein
MRVCSGASQCLYAIPGGHWHAPRRSLVLAPFRTIETDIVPLTVLPPIFFSWLVAFILTIAIEAPVYGALGRRTAPLGRCIIGGIMGSILTHPLLWFVWRHAIDDYLLRTVSGEILVCLVEGGVLWWIAKPMTWNRAMAISFVANATSYGTGILLHMAKVL